MVLGSPFVYRVLIATQAGDFGVPFVFLLEPTKKAFPKSKVRLKQLGEGGGRVVKKMGDLFRRMLI